MNNDFISNVFYGNYFQYIAKYKERIQKALYEYDVVIFMARKAICFYEAMRLNGEIKPTNCTVISSRATDYNILPHLKNKRILVVDDVVVKGDSLRVVVSRLKEYDIHPDVLVIACEREFPATLGDNQDYNLKDSYLTLTKEGIYSFAAMITEYIEASMCPFNVDQPIYTIKADWEEIKRITYQDHAVDITSGVQQKFGIKSTVIYITLKELANENGTVLQMLHKSILKLRILWNGNRIIAIPFVLFPEISLEQIEELFNLIKSDHIVNFLHNPRPLVYREGQMKLLCYMMSTALAEVFFERQGLSYEKCSACDQYHFSFDTESLFLDGKSRYKEIKTLFSEYEVLPVNYSKFSFPNILAVCYQIIAKIKPAEQHYLNADGKKLEREPIITHQMLTQQIMQEMSFDEDIPQLASCAIDVLIDRGMIVPSIVHTENAIVRGYKLGEYSKLTRVEIKAFIAMLYEYQQMINDSLNKTEFEKLCVLFFRQMQERGKFKQQDTYEDGCYSICYSLYGPRVSSSAVTYRVNPRSALITDFCSIYDDFKSSVLLQHDKYVIQAQSPDKQYKDYCNAFAFQYCMLKGVFDKEKQIQGDNQKTPWNMYVHSYIQYLTLRAIGNSKKNQFLSLCAELFQMAQLPDNFFSFARDIRKPSERILSGINSGLWKYWCYKGDALNKTTQQIWEKDQTAGVVLLMDQEGVSDQRTEWDDVIDKAGNLLYSIAFFIQESLVAMDASGVFSVDDEFSGNKPNNSEKKKCQIFSKGSYYNSNKLIKKLRHDISAEVRCRSEKDGFEDWCKSQLRLYKRRASALLDLCDLILVSNVPSWSLVDQALVVYSKTGVFPESVFQNYTELRLDRLRNREKVRIFGLNNSDEYKSAVQDCQAYLDLKYFALDLKEIDLGICKNEEGESVSRLVTVFDAIIDNLAHNEQTEAADSDQGQAIDWQTYIKKQALMSRESVLTNNRFWRNIRSLAEASSVEINVYFNPICIIENSGSIGNTYIGGLIMPTVNMRDVNGNMTVADNIGVVNNTNAFQAMSEGMRNELAGLLSQADESGKAKIREAIDALDNQDESKFVSALKKVCSFVKDVAANAAGSAIAQYMILRGITM